MRLPGIEDLDRAEAVAMKILLDAVKSPEANMKYVERKIVQIIKIRWFRAEFYGIPEIKKKGIYCSPKMN